MTIPTTAVVYDSFDDTSSTIWPVSDSGHTYSLLGAGGTNAIGWSVDANGAEHNVSNGPAIAGTITVKEQSTGTSVIVNVPAGAATGEKLVAVIVPSGGTVTAPAGWDAETSNAGTTVGVFVYSRDVDTEPASYTWTGLTTGRTTAFMCRVAGADLTDFLCATASVGTNTGSGSTCVVATQTTDTDNALMLTVVGGNAAVGLTWTQPTGMTLESTSTGTGRGAALAVAGQGAKGASGTKTWTWSSTNLEMRAVMIAIKPATADSSAFRFSVVSDADLADVDMEITGSLALSDILGAQVEFLGAMFRYTDSSHYYLARVDVQTDETMNLHLYGYGAASTSIGSVTGILSGASYASGDELALRVDTFGARIRVKVWNTTDTEPDDWTLTVYDSGFIGSGGVGIRTGVAASNTNDKPVVATYTEWWAGEPATVSGADMLHGEGTIRVEIAFGADLTVDEDLWPFVDVTADVYYPDKVKITAGRPDETSQARPASCGFTLLNQAGDYTAYNANSKYHPNVRRNTPVRVMFDAGDGAEKLFLGYMVGAVPKWNTAATKATVVVTAAGTLRRLTQGKTPLRTPLYRAILGDGPIAYWSMEDGSDAAACASAISGQPALGSASGIPTLGEDGSVGSAAAVAFDSGGSLRAVLKGIGSSWTLEWSMKLPATFPTGASDAFRSVWTMTCPTGVYIMSLIVTENVDTGSSEPLLCVDFVEPDGTDTLLSQANFAAADVYDDTWHNYAVVAKLDTSGDAITEIYQDGTKVADSFDSMTSSLATAGTLLCIVDVGTVPTSATTPWVPCDDAIVEHFAIYDGEVLVDHEDAMNGFVGETADDRITRLCGEEGVDVTVTGTSDTKLGAQPVAAFVDILHDAETADGGVLYDGFGKGLGYICRSSRYNLTAAITLDADLEQVAPPFEPVDDDQRNRNDITITRSGGSSARVVDEDGPLGTNEIETYDSSITVNVESDAQLPDRASWEVHLGTVEGFRYPTLNIDLVKNPDLIADWLAAADISFRADVNNVVNEATQHPPDDVSLIVEGYTHTINLQSWKISGNCSQYEPWQIGVYDTDRYDSGSSTLDAAITTTDTTFDVATTDDDDLWTTSAAAFPFDGNLAGERVTITDITGTTSPQSFTVTRSVNGVVKAHAAGTEVHIWQPAIVGL